MSPQVFDSVSWKDVQNTLKSKPRMYQLWYGKQCLGYCGTGVMLKRWDKHKKADFSCSNCGMVDKDVEHLNRCDNQDRRRLLAKHIVEIED